MALHPRPTLTPVRFNNGTHCITTNRGRLPLPEQQEKEESKGEGRRSEVREEERRK